MKGFRRLAVILVIVLLAQTFRADGDGAMVSASTTQQQIQQKEEEKEALENELNQTQQDLEGLREEHSSLQGELNNLNTQLSEVSQNLEELESQISEKEQDILEARIFPEMGNSSEEWPFVTDYQDYGQTIDLPAGQTVETAFSFTQREDVKTGRYTIAFC